jgi:hypothetical protein
MKNVIFLLLLLPSVCFGQSDEFPSPFEFKYVDTTIKGSKEELFVRAKAWMARNYRSANDVIQLSDKDAGKLVGKGTFKAPAKPMGMGNYYWVRYSVIIDVRDNKIRMKLTDFYQEGSSYKNGMDGGSLNNEKPERGFMHMAQVTWENIKEFSFDYSKTLIRKFKKEMRQSATNTIDEDGF